MNAARRKDLETAIDLIEQAKTIVSGCLDEEQEYYDNMPESLQGSDRGSQAEIAINGLDSALAGLDEVTSNIEGATE